MELIVMQVYAVGSDVVLCYGYQCLLMYLSKMGYLQVEEDALDLCGVVLWYTVYPCYFLLVLPRTWSWKDVWQCYGMHHRSV
jgi:hypothetical protein